MGEPMGEPFDYKTLYSEYGIAAEGEAAAVRQVLGLELLPVPAFRPRPTNATNGNILFLLRLLQRDTAFIAPPRFLSGGCTFATFWTAAPRWPTATASRRARSSPCPWGP